MKHRDLCIAAYDVADPKRLRAVLKRVKAHATGGQKSAYECFLTQAERQELLADLRGIVSGQLTT